MVVFDPDQSTSKRASVLMNQWKCGDRSDSHLSCVAFPIPSHIATQAWAKLRLLYVMCADT